MSTHLPIYPSAPSPASQGLPLPARRPDQPKRVLLTNPYGPYEMKWGTAPTDLLGSRLARGNKMFDRNAVLPSWALYMIAENISNPCLVLEWPRWDDFLEAVRDGYDVIAIQLMSLHTDRVAEMVRAIRKYSPDSEIVIGGYGVAALNSPPPGDKAGSARYIHDNADHLCRAEGVGFMRELLEDGPIDRPVTQYHLPPSRIQPLGAGSDGIAIPAILVGLGCPAACDFCNTSAFFYHKKLRVASPAQVYEFMKAHQRRTGQSAMRFILFDEDMFLDPDYVRELGRLIRSNRRTWGFRWFSFGSVSSVSQFEPRELRECGVEAIWIGVESSLFDPDQDRPGFSKREGKEPQQLFRELHEVGIETIGSMILGFDFHTPQNIENDIDYFVSLEPTLYQVGPITPCPGTKLFRSMVKQERLSDDFQWSDFHLWKSDSHEHPNFNPGELRKFYDLAHEKLANKNGPTTVGVFACALKASQSLAGAETEYLRYQARRSLDTVTGMIPLMRAIVIDPPSPQVKARVQGLLDQAEAAIGDDGMRKKLFRQVAGQVIASSGLLEGSGARVSAMQDSELYAPPVRWTYFNEPGSAYPRVEESPVAEPPTPLNGSKGSNGKPPGLLGALSSDGRKTLVRRGLFSLAKLQTAWTRKPNAGHRWAEPSAEAERRDVLSPKQAFFSHERYAVVGHSDRGGFPRLSLSGLQEAGKTVYAVDSSSNRIDSTATYPDLEALPEPVDAMIVEVPKEETAAWIERAAAAGIKRVWVHMMRDTPQAKAVAASHGIDLYTGGCAAMYLKGGPIHSAHRRLNQRLGTY